MENFSHLWCHSNYSLMRGASAIGELCRATQGLGMKALALTEVNGLYGAVRFWNAARETGIQPILRAELRTATERVILLCRTPQGYERLCRILTRRWLLPENAVPGEEGTQFDPCRELAEDSEGLVILCPSPGLVEKLVRRRGNQDLYLALGPGGRSRAGIERAGRLGVPPVAANDVHFVHRDQHPLHRLLRAIAGNTTLDRVDPADLASEEAWLRSPREMADLHPHCPEAIANAARLAADCAMSEPPWGKLIFPRYRDLNADETFRTLRARCDEGARIRYGGRISPQVRQRLDHELRLIRDKGFADYFLIVQEIVNRSPRTCGRGSAAASVVSYCLGITHVDPVRYDLYFERFLNQGRVDPPDIDVDFCWDERDDLLDQLFESYGVARTAMISNHVGFRARAAVREVAKVYGLTAAEIKKVTGRLSGFWRSVDIDKEIRTHPLFRDLNLQEPWPEILGWASRLEGFPRNLSVHCGGVVLVPDDVSRYVPVQLAAKGVRIIQWEKDQAEEAGLVKIDLLGNRSLSVVRDSLAAVRSNHGVEICYARFNPLEDLRTQELIRDGDTIGVFYVESPAMRQLQQKTRRGDFDHLVIHSSLIRPAANDYIREYVRRLRGGRYRSLHPILGRVLRETYGIMCYQEDVSRVAIEMAGFDDAEADGLRKVLSKKWAGRQVKDYRERFTAGARLRGVSDPVIEQVWEMILSFSGYSFCKPHSASYALLSFKSAYLKAHYPAEFLAAVISNQGGFYSTFAYISEARRLGLDVRLPDVNDSDRSYTGIRQRIRVGLMQIKGMRDDSIEAILKERRRAGPYLSLGDFLKRVAIDPSDVKLLIRAGTFDGIAHGASRPDLLWRLYRWAAERSSRRAEAFAFAAEAPIPPRARPYSEVKVLQDEIDTLGFLISCHPLTLYRQALADVRYVPGKDLRRWVGRKVTTLGWLITGKVVETKKGEPMEFLSFEDTTAIYETTFFPQAYARFCHLLTTARPFLLHGKVEEDFGAVTLTVEKASLVGLAKGVVGKRRKGLPGREKNHLFSARENTERNPVIHQGK